jgi:hypothetical protein
MTFKKTDFLPLELCKSFYLYPGYSALQRLYRAPTGKGYNGIEKLPSLNSSSDQLISKYRTQAYVQAPRQCDRIEKLP